MKLTEKKCLPCEGIGEPLQADKIKELCKEIPHWKLLDEEEPFSLKRTFTFKDFSQSMNFVHQVAAIAENDNHHPTILINWNKVTLTLTTHALKGLSENDFILAAKIDEIAH